MWKKLVAFVEDAAFWLFFLGTLLLMHLVDAQVLDLPSTVVRYVNQVPRIVYPIFYGILGLYALRPLQAKITNPKMLGRLFIILFFVLFLVAAFFDLPHFGLLNTRYAVVFLLTILGGLVFVCVSQILGDRDEKMRRPLAHIAGGSVMPDGSLSRSFSWFWCPNDDLRNRELVTAIKSKVGTIFLVFVGGNIFMGLLNLINQPSSDRSLVLDIALPTVGIWIFVIFVIARLNRKSWAPSVDADKKLRRHFGAKYDAELDGQLETNSIKDLLDENWFVRMYGHMNDVDVQDPRV